MIRFSACRRMRVVKWSSLNRFSRISGSSVRRSMESSRLSWRCSRAWLRQARLRKTWPTPLRRVAWPTAASTAVPLYVRERPGDGRPPRPCGRCPAPASRRGVDVLSPAQPLDQPGQPLPRPARRPSSAASSARRPGSGRTGRRARSTRTTASRPSPTTSTMRSRPVTTRLSPLSVARCRSLAALPVSPVNASLASRCQSAAATGGLPVRSQAKTASSARSKRW